MSKTSVEEITFPNFTEFINHIWPNDKLSWGPYQNFFFRGERKVRPLLPTLLRPNVLEHIVNQRIFKGIPLYKFPDRIIQAELMLIRDFYIHSDLEGLPVPEMPIFRETITDSFWYDFDKMNQFIREKTWMPNEFHEIAGIAQHYGVPTRLLDWSLNLTTAIYFACSGVVNEFGPNSDLYRSIYFDKENKKKLFFVIWALNPEKLGEKSHGLLKSIRPRFESNPNLTAQRGVFTIRFFQPDESDRMPLEEFVVKTIQRDQPDKPNNATLYKFLIPQHSAQDGLDYLERMGVTEKTIFPGFNGVAKYIKRRQNMI